MSKEYVYVLQLTNGKYYVGKTRDLEERLLAHQWNPSCKWIQRYSPIVGVVHTQPSHSSFDEDIVTKSYMRTYGIDNVRGGSYTRFQLTNEQTRLLQRELRSSDNSCFKCGKQGHFSSQCYAKRSVSQQKRPSKAYKRHYSSSDDSDQSFDNNYTYNSFTRFQRHDQYAYSFTSDNSSDFEEW